MLFMCDFDFIFYYVFPSYLIGLFFFFNGSTKKLYAAMHEPDGVAGVSAIREAEPSLKEQILEHESIGLLRDATACYDRAIQLEPDQVR